MMHFLVFIMQKEQEHSFLESCCSWWCCHMLSKHYAGGWNTCPGTGKSELSQTYQDSVENNSCSGSLNLSPQTLNIV